MNSQVQSRVERSPASDVARVGMFIDGAWRFPDAGEALAVRSPATGECVATVAVADEAALEAALAAAHRGFLVWRDAGASTRSHVLRRAASLLTAQASDMALALTREQGKPLAESLAEISSAAEILDWFADEARRAYGRIIPARYPDVQQTVVREPVGPVAAFTPWNFPVSQTARKIGAALAAGCSMILKPPEDAPVAVSLLADVFARSGLPAGVLNLVYGHPARISSQLISDSRVRKVSFTGSVTVGKQLAALAAQHMKPCTMELGGHAPAIVSETADLPEAAELLCRAKFRNAGQVCVSPTRFLVQRSVYEPFLALFLARVADIRLGNGCEPGVTMGPLIHERRVQAVQALVADAVSQGARVRAGGSLDARGGCYVQPTVLSEVTASMRAMNEEPFGPLALFRPYDTLADAVEEANRLPFGLASYAFTRSASEMATLERALEVGMLSINHLGLALPETPFGGVRDSGYGSEGGSEAIEAYLTTKFISKKAA